MGLPLKITPIHWVTAPSIWWRLKNYLKSNGIGWIKYLRPNSSGKIVQLDQKKNGWCTVFACCGATMYNTGLVFDSEEARTMVMEVQAQNWAPLGNIVDIFARAFSLTSDRFKNPLDSNAQEILNKWYWMPIQIRFGPAFFADGMKNGKITNYSTKDSFSHAVWIRKEKEKYIIVNSWGEYVKLGYHNEYEVDINELIKYSQIEVNCFFIW